MFINRRIKLFIFCSIGVLLSLSIFHTLQGPRLISEHRIGVLANTQIVLSYNANLDKTAPGIAIEPSIAFSSTIVGQQLTIQFEEALKTNTSYTIRLSNVQDLRGKRTTDTVRFKTEAQELAYLRRSTNGPDAIYQKNMATKNEQKLVEKERIGSFAAGKDNRIAIITESTSPMLETELSITTAEQTTVVQPPLGLATNISGISTSPYFLVTTQELQTYQNHLYILDARNNSFRELLASDNKPLDAQFVQFARDGRTIMYQDVMSKAMYIDDLEDNQPPKTLGVVDRMLRYLPNDGGFFVDSGDGRYKMISSTPEDSFEFSSATATTILPLMNSDQLLLLNNRYQSSGSQQDIVVFSRTENKTIQKISTSASNEEVVQNLSISPTDEFISYITASPTAGYDDYRLHPMLREASLLIYDSRSSGLLDTIPATQYQWL